MVRFSRGYVRYMFVTDVMMVGRGNGKGQSSVSAVFGACHSDAGLRQGSAFSGKYAILSPPPLTYQYMLALPKHNKHLQTFLNLKEVLTLYFPACQQMLIFMRRATSNFLPTLSQLWKQQKSCFISRTVKQTVYDLIFLDRELQCRGVSLTFLIVESYFIHLPSFSHNYNPLLSHS